MACESIQIVTSTYMAVAAGTESLFSSVTVMAGKFQETVQTPHHVETATYKCPTLSSPPSHTCDLRENAENHLQLKY